MKYGFFLSLVLLLFSCSKSDSEQLIAKWRFTRVYEGKKLYVSTDKKEQDAIVERELKRNESQLELMNMTAENYRKSMLADMKLMLKVTFEFKSDSTVTISSNNPKEKNESKWKYTIDEEKHHLTIEEETRTIKYTYQLKGNQLILKDENAQVEFEKVTQK